MTRKIRFIHAADLHLGAPTRGLGALSDEWAARLYTAIPEAYDRVIETALSRKVDFVVLAGDMFDASHASYCDYLHFFEGLDKLHEAGIPAYLVTGNHDPYTTWARDISRLPDSAHMMGIGVPTFELYERDGEPLCLIGGRSYYGQAWPLDESISDGITRENAIGALAEEHPRASDAPFSIGIIHTGLDLDASKAASDEAQLLAQDIDYWACGHLHRHFVRPIIDDPRIVFPGCVQGRDIKESGERGCYLVELTEGVSPRIEFVPTASVAFHSLDVDVGDCQTLSDVERIVRVALFRENGHDYCSEMIARVKLVGETDLHGFLRQPDVIASMRKHVNDTCTGFFCDAIIDGTQPLSRESAASQLGFSAKDTDAKLIDYVQSTLVQRGIAVPDALGRRMGDFRKAAVTLVGDLLDEHGDGLDAASAREEVAQRIVTRLDRDGSNEESIYQLGDQLEAKYVEVRKADEATAALQQEDREMRELTAGQKVATARMVVLSDEVEALSAWRDELLDVDTRIAEQQDDLSHLRESTKELESLADEEPSIDSRLLELSAADDRALRDRLEGLSAEWEKAKQAADEAKERSSTSTVAYEALMEIDESDGRAGKWGTRTAQIAVSVLFPIAFIVAGIPLFVHGRQVNSLSFTAFGIALVVLAFFLAAAAIVMLFRPDKGAEALESRRKDAHWVMLQDKKLLEARQVEKSQVEEEVTALLERMGLHDADGSIRQALMLLDDAKDMRARMAERRQRMMALDMHVASVSEALGELELRRRRIEEESGLEAGASVRVIEATLRAKNAEAEELEAELGAMTTRLTTLTHKLDRAKNDRTFDRIKLDYHQIRARLRVAKHDYVTLLLAQRLLEHL